MVQFIQLLNKLQAFSTPSHSKAYEVRKQTHVDAAKSECESDIIILNTLSEICLPRDG